MAFGTGQIMESCNSPLGGISVITDDSSGKAVDENDRSQQAFSHPWSSQISKQTMEYPHEHVLERG